MNPLQAVYGRHFDGFVAKLYIPAPTTTALSTVLGTGVLSGGSTNVTTSALKVGGDRIKAVYGGDSNFSGSTATVGYFRGGYNARPLK